jgi:hypothetical protein
MTVTPPITVFFVLPWLCLASPASAPNGHAPEGAATREAAPFAENACVQCHRTLAGRSAEIVDLEWARSVHYENNIGCDGCHGGDASAEQYLALEAAGYRNLSLGQMHHNTADTLSRLRRVFHSFNMRDINELARSIEAVAGQTDYASKLVESLQRARRNQTIVGIAAVLFLLVFAASLVYYKHAYCEDYDRSSAVPDSTGEV